MYSLEIMCQKLFKVFMTPSILYIVPTNVIHSEKRWENSFVVKFFHREGWTIKQGYNQLMVNTISLGMAHGTPLDISNSWFAHLSTLFFGHHISVCINLERIYIVSMFSFALLLWIMRPPAVSFLYEYEISAGIKRKLCLDVSKRKG